MDPDSLSRGIKHINGLEFLQSVLHDVKPVGSSFFEGLDALIGSDGLKRGDLIEIQGLSGSGKTELLTFLTMTALLPETWSVQLEGTLVKMKVGGKGRTVVWIDCTQRMPVSRITSLMHAHLRQLVDKRPVGLLPPSNADFENVIKSSLARLHVFSPSSTLQLAATLRSLPDYVATTPSCSADIAYLMIDGMSEFSWQDALAARNKSNVPSLKHVIAALAHVKARLAPVTFITQWVLKEAPTHVSSESYPFYQHHLVSPWPSIAIPSPAADTQRRNPLRAEPQAGEESDTFRFKYHITTHTPPVEEIKNGVTFNHALSRRHETLPDSERFVAVLRVAGGREIGSWRFRIGQYSISG